MTCCLLPCSIISRLFEQLPGHLGACGNVHSTDQRLRDVVWEVVEARPLLGRDLSNVYEWRKETPRLRLESHPNLSGSEELRSGQPAFSASVWYALSTSRTWSGPAPRWHML